MLHCESSLTQRWQTISVTLLDHCPLLEHGYTSRLTEAMLPTSGTEIKPTAEEV